MAELNLGFPWWYIVIAVLPLPSLWSIWHIWAHEFVSLQHKAAWLCFVVFVPVIAGFIYIVYGRRHALGRVRKNS